MYIETEGIILKQHKILEDRRMLTLFTKRYGKISVGAAHTSRGKTRSSLALKPFTLGKYELYKGRNVFNIQNAETVKSYYKIGEDIEKYENASIVMELTEKILPEGEPVPRVYELLLDFLAVMEKRSKEYGTIKMAYQLKMLKYSGNMPHTKDCMKCGRASDDHFFFDIAEGGIICGSCMKSNPDNKLIYQVNAAIINVVNYISVNPLDVLGRIKIENKVLPVINEIIKAYIKYHLGIDQLKSEGFAAFKNFKMEG